MLIKKIPAIFTLVASLLFLTSCHDDYFKRIELMEGQVENLQTLCDQINENIYSLQRLSISLQMKDRITKLTKLYSDDGQEVIGYKISFNTNSAITIYDGVAGKIPVIGTKYLVNEGGFFWTVQYDNDPVNYLTDASGNKIPANGSIIPFLKVVDGRWLVSYDSGKTFTDIGQATGESADTMFKSFKISDDYVEIVLTNGTTFKIPTQAAYEKLKQSTNEVNTNLAALKVLTKDIKDSVFVFITDMKDIKNEKDSVIGKRVFLSDGTDFPIYSYISSLVPIINAVKDTTDNNYYWGLKFDDSEFEWMLDEDGQRINVLSSQTNAPIFGAAVDTIATSANKGLYVWTFEKNGTPEYVFDNDSHTIQAVMNGNLFASITDKGAYVDFKIKATEETFKLYKKYAVVLDSTNFAMAVSDTVTVKYNLCGFDNESVDFITQDGFKAIADTAANSIRIISPAAFTSKASQVMAFFKYGDNDYSSTVTATFNITKKEEDE